MNDLSQPPRTPPGPAPKGGGKGQRPPGLVFFVLVEAGIVNAFPCAKVAVVQLGRETAQECAHLAIYSGHPAGELATADGGEEGLVELEGRELLVERHQPVQEGGSRAWCGHDVHGLTERDLPIVGVQHVVDPLRCPVDRP